MTPAGSLLLPRPRLSSHSCTTVQRLKDWCQSLVVDCAATVLQVQQDAVDGEGLT